MKIKEMNIFGRCPKLKIQITLMVSILPLLTNCQHHEKTTKKMDYVHMVYPLLDTENSRWFFFSSACRPFGMVNLSPDTEVDGAWGSGYRYNIDTIKGFSHIHAWQLSGLSVMPLALDRLSEGDIYDYYYSSFDHERENVSPGYHQLYLDRYDINVELTSTKRVGFHKYSFETTKPAILINLNGQLGPSKIVDGSIKQVEARVLEGKLTNAPTRRRPKPTSIFFRVELDTDIEAFTVSQNLGKCLLELPSSSRDVKMKVAISYTSTENAAFNLNHELPHWDFEKVVQESKDEWNSYLSRIKVEGGTHEEQRRFYTDLWHALQGRRIINDANGAYPDNTGETFRIGQLPLTEDGKPNFNHYNSDSFWGAQWTINTLWQLVYPEIAEEFCNSLVQYYKDGGTIPRGPSGGNYTYVMTGSSATPFLVSAWLKGITGFDINKAYEGLKKGHMPGGIMSKAGYEHRSTTGGGLEYYIEKGYVPYPLPEGNGFGYHQDGGGMTMEYAFQDWTLAQLAKHLDKQEDYEYFHKRSDNYKNIFDTSIGWIRPKDENGEWKTPYDPFEYRKGFVESNGAQMTWFVPHDLHGLAELMGGKEAAVEKLNESFQIAQKQGFTSGKSHDKEEDARNRRTPINYGNQPSMQTAFIFNRLGHPDLTRYWVKQVIDSVYTGLSTQEGFNGDEDQGLMGSLSVLMKLGLFQMTGAEDDPIYDITVPEFDQIKIKLNKDYYAADEIVIQNKVDPSNVKFKVSLNNVAVDKMQIGHSELVKGGQLIFENE
ncbi:GH92 family glycosyl hydrolase [Fulvivirgaceae bacterium BMA12]|uniref:GH92 family glycosyl hydrolase n=1 Tax=Agaribacillus aureus TaxID=3051825 RepID=A0ABT8L6S5_9BACT|nr:GH92 family glycosyl hydrolase [Fulvivirgaceae bacterium BMA12]